MDIEIAVDVEMHDGSTRSMSVTRNIIADPDFSVIDVLMEFLDANPDMTPESEQRWERASITLDAKTIFGG